MYQIFFKALKVSFCIFLTCAFGPQAIAQDKNVVDSLVRVLKSSPSEKVVMAAKIELGWEYLNNDDVKAEEYAREGFLLAKQFGDSAKMVKAGRVRGGALKGLERAQEAIPILTEVLPIARRNIQLRDEYRKILNTLALAHTFMAEYDKALEYNFQSLVLTESEGGKGEVGRALNNIGLVYFKLHNYDAALKYFNGSLTVFNEILDTAYIPSVHLNLGLSYIHLGDFKQAKFHTSKALELCGDHCSDEIQIMGNFGHGEASYWLDDLVNANKLLNLSLSIARNTNNKRWQAENLVYLGAVAIKQKDYKGAIAALTEADSIARNSGYNQLLMDTYRHLANLYNETEDFKNAAVFQRKYITLSDTLVSQQLVKKISKIQSNYEERENIATIASKEVLIGQQRDLNIAITGIAMLAGLLLLVLQSGNRTIKRVNAKLSEAKEIIQQQNHELENKNRELDIEVDKKTVDLGRVNQSLKQVNDELDNFIYKTSHDIRGPLASLKGMCNVALMDVKDPIALEYLRKLDATAERLNSILTRLVIINQINNSKLTIENIDFSNIINDVLLLEKKKGLPPELRINTFIDPHATIESDKELVRIVLENLIDNAIKFYNDSDRVESFMNVHISSMHDDGVKVRVIDNGIGISESSPGKLFQMFSRASERSETGGIGLYITKTATEKIGGRVGLLTTPEGYTEFYVIFPKTPYPESQRLERRTGS